MKPVLESECSMACSGAANETCGGSSRLSVYQLGSGSTQAPTTNPGPPGWKFVGCYTDDVNARTLSTAQSVAAGSSGMTVAQCVSACQANGYTVSGVEYQDQCFCDTSVRSTAQLVTSGCDMLCAGNSSEYCGGSSRIDVYTSTAGSAPYIPNGGVPIGWTDIGCYTDNGSNRTLSAMEQVPGGYTNMTIEGCLQVCQSNNFVYGGLEYGQECWCSNAILNGGGCAADPTTCYMPCKGQNAEQCGGPDRLHMFYSGQNPAVTSCAPPTSTTSSTSATTSSTSTTSSVSTITSSPTISTTPTSSTATVSSTSCTYATPSYTSCPAFWSTVAQDLANSMRTNNICNNIARAAIRFAFHDAAAFSTSLPTYCPASGGADGSLLLSPTEINRTENAGLNDVHDFLLQKYNSYKSAGYAISAADLIQVAGALGVLACQNGAVGLIKVGRQETDVAAPPNLLPEAFGVGATHDVIYNLFLDKGIGARDLAALIGAHTCARTFFETQNGIASGAPQDTTPENWDVVYYNETITGAPGIGRLEADINLGSNASSAVGIQFQSFIGRQGQLVVTVLRRTIMLTLCSHLGCPIQLSVPEFGHSWANTGCTFQSRRLHPVHHQSEIPGKPFKRREFYHLDLQSTMDQPHALTPHPSPPHPNAKMRRQRDVQQLLSPHLNTTTETKRALNRRLLRSRFSTFHPSVMSSTFARLQARYLDMQRSIKG